MTDDIPTETKVVEQTEGAMVKCKSVRGSGTRDQDTVTARQYYDDITDAFDNAESVTLTVKAHMQRLRSMGDDGYER